MANILQKRTGTGKEVIKHPPVLVKFYHYPETRHFKINRGFLSFYHPNNICWQWDVNPKSFEVIHGLSRITKLIPDKLATAIAINYEKLPNDDGTYLIDIVTELVSFYRKMLLDADQAPSEPPPAKHILLFSFGYGLDLERGEPVSNVHQSLEAVMFLLSTFLNNFKGLLKERQPELISPAFNVAILADNILFMCNTYMSFIHPAWIQTGRSGLMDVPLYLKLRIATIAKNTENMASLRREFASILEQHKIETPIYGNNHHP